MPIVIKDFEPSGETEEVKLPGWKTPVKIPVARDVVTADISLEFASGNFTALISLFPKEKQRDVGALKGPQLEQLMNEWTGNRGN